MRIRKLIKNGKVKSLSGFSLVEVLLSVTLFTLFVLGLSGGLAYSMQSSEVTQYKSKAVFLADEGLEAVRSLRNASYDALAVGSHGLNSSGSTWNLSGTPETIGEYTRTIEISDVDANTKLIESKVTWLITVGGSNSVTVSTYLTNWLRVISQIWTNPKVANSYDISGNQDGVGIVYANNYAYAIRNTGTPNVVIMGITDSTQSILGSSNISASPTGISINPNGTIVSLTSATNNAEVNIYSLTNPAIPELASVYNATGNADATSSYITQLNRLYFTRARSNDKELMVLNITNPSSPTLLGSADFNSDLNDIVVDGNFAYLATEDVSQELVIYNISNPANITQTASFNAEGNIAAISITKLGSTVFLGTGSGNVHLINVSNPASPTLIGTYSLGSNIRINDIVVKPDGSLMFVSVENSNETFHVVNITNQASPIKLGSLNLGSTLNSLSYDTPRDRIYGIGADNNAEIVVINSQ